MQERRNAWFVPQENSFKLAIARDLQRIWSTVLEEPVPSSLGRLVEQLERNTDAGEGIATKQADDGPFRPQ